MTYDEWKAREPNDSEPDPGEHECELYWFASPATESGWKCVHCGHQPGEPPGFSAELDRSHTREKVMSVLMELTDADIVHVSNGTGGEAIENMVTERCRKENRFDQYSIAHFILELMTPSHAKYWNEVSDAIVAGKDPRERCACGKLATSFQFSSQGKGAYCSEHSPPLW